MVLGSKRPLTPSTVRGSEVCVARGFLAVSWCVVYMLVVWCGWSVGRHAVWAPTRCHYTPRKCTHSLCGDAVMKRRMYILLLCFFCSSITVTLLLFARCIAESWTCTFNVGFRAGVVMRTFWSIIIEDRVSNAGGVCFVPQQGVGGGGVRGIRGQRLRVIARYSSL